MRSACAFLLLVTLGLGAVLAEGEKIPIAVDLIHGVEVTEAQLDWVRAWLRKHLHADDLAKIEVDVRNRTHPGADYRAEARLAARESGTYWTQRVIRFAHRTWRTWVVKEDEFVGDWAVADFDRVQRIFDIDGKRKVMHLASSLSYNEVRAVLQVIARNGVVLVEGEPEKYRPNLAGVYWIEREDDGKIQIKSGTSLRGIWVAGHLKDDKFIVKTQGMYIS